MFMRIVKNCRTPIHGVLPLLSLLMSLMAVHAGAAEKARPESLERWREMRVGMFIHWGPVSITGKEISWSRANTNPKCPNHGPTPAAVYDNLYKEFNPTNFNAREWVAIAKAAGMKYMVLTAKHCDGFLLWDSKVDDYNIMHTPFKRDVCAELAKAAHESGMGLGWYYSPMDWRDPDCRNEKNSEFVGRMQEELRELLTNYGKVDLLWFDTDGRPSPWDQERTYALVRQLQPEIVINNRLDCGNPGHAHAHSPASVGPWADYYTPEQVIGGYNDGQPWESCMTVSRRGQWSWGGAGDGVKSVEACMDMLFRCVGGDGNLLLNVGPTPSGDIAMEQANLIKEMGSWLAKYGESIYGTRGGPFKPSSCGVSTRKGNTIYLHLLEMDEEPLRLPAIPAKVVGSRLLAGGKVDVRQTDAGIEVSVPKSACQPFDTVVALELDGPASGIPAVDVTALASLTTGAKATASNVFQKQAEYGPDRAVDGRDDTRWATDGGVTTAWLEVDLGKPASFHRAVIRQAYPELKRIRKFAVEYWQDEQWKPCCRGENLEARFSATFEPVTAQRVRLNITEATDGPTIWEFALFPAKTSK